LIIKRLTITAMTNPIMQRSSQVNADIQIENEIRSNIVVPRATSRPLSSSNILAVKYSGRAMKISRRIIRSTKTRMSKPQ
jgi:hypothetical protein